MMSRERTPPWRRYLRFIRPNPAADVDDELQFHLGMRIERNLALGMSPDDARREALQRFGNLRAIRHALVEHDQRQHAQTRRTEAMSDFFQDLRYGLRSLRRAPGLTAGVVLTLALGLGANMAMFSFLDVVFLRAPAGVEAPDEVRRVWTRIQFRTGPQFWPGFSYPQYEAVQAAVGDRVATALYRQPAVSRLGRGAEANEVRTSYTSASYFSLLGVRPALGRFFSEAENQPGNGASVAIASHAFFKRVLAGDAHALGKDLFVDGRPYTLIGVAREGFSGVDLDATDLWVPLFSQPAYGAEQASWWREHRVNGFQILLRSTGGNEAGDRSLEQRVAVGLRTPEALRAPRDTANVVRLGSIISAQGPGDKAQEVRIATRVAGVTAIVLLIACANVVNLLLARAVRRRREIAVRLAVGISRFRLARLLFTETMLLALFAGAGAVMAANWGGSLLRGLLLPEVRFAESASPMHWRVVGLALATGLLAGLAAGLLPVLQSLRTDVTGALKAGGGDGSARRTRAQSALVMVQAALSVVLLVGAGLFVASLRNVRGVRTGYDAGRLVYGSVQFDTRDSVREAREPQVLREIADRLRHAPGVAQVALSRMAPTRGFSSMVFHPDVDTTQYPKPFATYNVVSPEFFPTVGMRMLRGEDFPAVVSTMPAVVIVNEAMAEAQWPGMDAIGRCLRFAAPPEAECYTVIGVVETAMFDALLEKPQPQFYLPMDHLPAEAGKWISSLVVRARVGAREVASDQMQRAVRDAFPGGRPVIAALEQYLEPQYRPWRLGATLFSAFGVLALIVAAVGVYSTVSYTVAQRGHEFGVRSALGARTPDILRQVIGSSLRPVLVGVTIGALLALLGGRFIAALLYGIEPGHPGVMMGVAMVLVSIAAAAALGPAWRASHVDPVTVLRTD